MNGFVSYNLFENLSLLFNVNNLFDIVGIIEVEEGLVLDNDIICVCIINGCIMLFILKYFFY